MINVRLDKDEMIFGRRWTILDNLFLCIVNFSFIY